MTIRFDRRTVSGERLEDVLAQIRGHLAGHGLSDFTLAVSEGRVETYTGQHATPPRWLPGWRCDGDTALLAAARAAVSASGRSRWWVPGRSAPTARNPPDGAVFPTIGLGPGNEEDAHTIDESIALEQLEGARDIYRNLVLAVCG